MKKWIAGLGIICLLLAGCQTKTKEFREIEVDMMEVQTMVSNDESFNVLIKRDGCPYCEAMAEYIEETKAQHPDIILYVVDSTDFELKKESSDSKTLVSSTEDGQALLSLFPYFLYTPAIYHIEDGVPVQAGIGFDTQNNTVSLWGVDSTIDFDEAETMDLWEFLAQ